MIARAQAFPAPPRRPAVIELVGPAGTGKSAVAACLARRADVAAGSIWRLPPSLLAWGVARGLPSYVRLARRARAPLWRELKHMARLRALDLWLDGQELERYRFVILDEGPVFALTWLSVMGHAVFADHRSAAWRRYWSGLMACDLDAVVRLDAPDHVLAERIRKRAKPHVMRDRPSNEIAAFAARYRAGFDQVIAGVQRGSRLRVVEVATDQHSPEDLAQRILAMLGDD